MNRPAVGTAYRCERPSRFGDAGGTASVTFLLSGAAGDFKGLLKPPLKEEPLLRSPKGLQLLEQFLGDENPTLVRGDDMHDAAALLQAAPPGFAAMAVVPVRTPSRLLGFVVLYYRPDAALPSQSALDHLGVLARIVRSPLELAIARQSSTASPRSSTPRATSRTWAPSAHSMRAVSRPIPRLAPVTAQALRPSPRSIFAPQGVSRRSEIVTSVSPRRAR